MKTKALLIAAAVFASILTGCGGGGDGTRGPAIVTVDILSNGSTDDGDITLSGGFYSVVTSNQAPNTIRVELATVSETRGFMTFSLASIPVNASIQRATVFLPILLAVPAGSNTSVTLYPDMVDFPPLNPLWSQGTMGGVFNTAAIVPEAAFAVVPVPPNAEYDATFDATNAVIHANNLASPVVQIRLMAGAGFVEIDDLFNSTTGGGTPMLRVEYI